MSSGSDLILGAPTKLCLSSHTYSNSSSPVTVFVFVFRCMQFWPPIEARAQSILSSSMRLRPPRSSWTFSLLDSLGLEDDFPLRFHRISRFRVYLDNQYC